ncbi:MAG: hypothetical protein J7L95_07290, partial [Prolixibacteraceae bacterium]|nr:hypothetical protein [Prolixibacteraceae bacterium]
MKIFFMKGIYVKILVIAICFALPLKALSQRSSGLAVEGRVSVQEGTVEGAVIQMYEDGRRLDDYGIGPDGKYKVELSYNHKYELIFVLKDNFSQKITIETTVPAAVLQSNPKFPPFPVDINLFTEIPGIDRSFSEKAILKIYYSKSVDNFISELYYNNAQIKKLIDQAILQSQMIGKEADYLSKLTRAEIAALRKEYNQLLKDAEKDYSNEKFLAALDGYKAANKVFPNEQYPKDRIAEINDLLGLMMAAEEMNSALKERFNSLIKDADLLFEQAHYFEAKNLYNRALSILPNNVHAQQQIAIINDLLKKQKVEEQYRNLIVKGDNSFKEMLYKEAISQYQKALQLKSGEAYPKNKIDEINAILARQEKDLKKQESYKQAIFQAETMFEKQFYEKALASYKNALNFKPGDSLAQQKIDEINALMKNLANKTLYDKFIKSADKSFNRKMYREALNDYKQALALLPNEKHPAERIDKITTILNSEEAFAGFIKQGDTWFDNQKYIDSKSSYGKALEIHSNDKHALEQIRKIDNILAQQGVDEQYAAIIIDADKLFDLKNYKNSKSKYREALALKSKESYPKERIAEIDRILQQIDRRNRQYLETIARADKLFQRNDYVGAKPIYAEAGNLKPDETYPPEMLHKIDSLLQEQSRVLAEQKAAEQARIAAKAEAEQVRLEALQKQKNRQYQQIVDEADQLMAENKLVKAVGKFRAALDVKPNEQYPIVRIEEIRGMITHRQEQQKAYEEAVARGDKDFRRESFDTAKQAYNEAKQAKPAESYPGEMIAKIDSIVTTRARLAAEAAAAEKARLAALQAEKDKNYTDALTKADALFNQKAYEDARSGYRLALSIKP